MQRNDVAVFKKLVQRNVSNTAVCCGISVISDNIHSEAAADVNKYPSDLTCSDNTNSLAVQIKSGEPA